MILAREKKVIHVKTARGGGAVSDDLAIDVSLGCKSEYPFRYKAEGDSQVGFSEYNFSPVYLPSLHKQWNVI